MTDGRDSCLELGPRPFSFKGGRRTVSVRELDKLTRAEGTLSSELPRAAPASLPVLPASFFRHLLFPVFLSLRCSTRESHRPEADKRNQAQVPSWGGRGRWGGKGTVQGGDTGKTRRGETTDAPGQISKP